MSDRTQYDRGGRRQAAGSGYEFTPGAFREADAFPLVSEIYVDQAPAWLRLDGDHRRKTAADYESKQPFVKGDDA